MSWIYAAVGIGGALIGAVGSNSAANTQADAANAATATQKAMFDQTQQNVAPWLQAGQGALAQQIAGTQPGGELNQQIYQPPTMQQLQQDPGYQFQLQQGTNALENASSLSGGMNSNNLKGLLGFTQGLANTDYQTMLNNYMTQFQLGNQTRQSQFNNLGAISSGGMGAGLGVGQVSANVGQNIGQNIIGAGNVQAAGTVGVANALTGGASSAYNNYLQQQYLQPQQQQTYIQQGA